MAYQSLYRRYRSKNFAEIKGQPHVTSALRTAVAEGRHGHAYLFSGPRGTGKTSSARVLAKALNCENTVDGEPCTTCDSCISIDQGKSFDLHELDAASNNKVDDIRDLIAKVQLGSPGRTKVYILDEVHMLSTGAENALLKTLEEPPDHVVFVLATTEPHKVVPTIRSRTQHFEFHLLPADDLAEHVAYVIDDAGLDVDADAIEYALAQGGGSARDTLSALDLVAAAGGVPTGSNAGIELVRSIGAGDAAASIRLIQEALVNGLQPRLIGEQMLDVLRDTFLAVMGASLDHLSDTARADIEGLAADLKPATLTRSMEMVGQALIEIRQAPDPRVPLEVAVLRLAKRDGTDLAGLLQRIEALEAQVSSGVVAQAPAASASASAEPAPTPASTTTAAAQPAPVASPAASSAAVPTGAGSASGEDTQPSPAAQPARSAAPPASPAANKPSADTPAPARRPRSPRAARPAPTAQTPSAQTPSAQAASSEPASPPTEQTAQPAAPQTNEPAPQSQPEPAPATSQPAQPAAAPNPAPATSQPEPAAPQPAPAAGAAPTQKLTVSSAQDALAKSLERVSQKARVRFKGGTVSAAEDTTVIFAAPNQIHRDRCAEVKHDVEAALSEHFGAAITVEVVVDGDALGSTIMDPTKIDRSARKEPEAAEDIGPVSELADADDTASTGVDRLTKAFPGSKVIEHNSSD